MIINFERSLLRCAIPGPFTLAIFSSTSQNDVYDRNIQYNMCPKLRTPRCIIERGAKPTFESMISNRRFGVTKSLWLSMCSAGQRNTRYSPCLQAFGSCPRTSSTSQWSVYRTVPTDCYWLPIPPRSLISTPSTLASLRSLIRSRSPVGSIVLYLGFCFLLLLYSSSFSSISPRFPCFLLYLCPPCRLPVRCGSRGGRPGGR